MPVPRIGLRVFTLLWLLPTALAGADVIPLPAGEPRRALVTPRGLLVGTDAGLFQREGASWSLALTRGGVRDLARGPDATWIATPRGLFVWPDRSARPLPVSLGAGARVEAVAVDPRGRVYAGTAVGLFVRDPQSSVFVRAHALPAGEVLAVAVGGDTVWVAVRGRIFRSNGEGSFAEALHEPQEGWHELRAVGELEDGALLAVPRGVWRLRGARAERFTLGIGELHALVRRGEQLWLAGERGVFSLPLPALGVASPERVAAGRSVALLAQGDRLLSLSSRGLIALAPGSHVASPAGLRDPGRRLGFGPPVLHRAVLRQQGLEPERLARVEELARSAALLPEVRMAFSYGRDRARDHKADQIFSSGALRQLLDSTVERDTGFDLSLQLTWDLHTHRDPDRAIAVSRERRELVELRDQVLERVNRLYFEWQNVESQRQVQGDPAQSASLALRSRELAADLDGWTGGLFSRLAQGSPQQHGRTE